MIRKIFKKITPKFLLSPYHFFWAFFSALFYGFPSCKIKVIGITGTNGKTTTANLTAAILEEAGYKVAVASSIKFKIGEEERENKLKMTMPGRAVLQKFLRDAVRAGCQYAIIECTSEGVLQSRNKFIRFEIMVFTNLSPEHIEHHGGFENYRKAKGEYFKACKNVHVVNGDDENTGYFLRFPAQQKFLFFLNRGSFENFQNRQQDKQAHNTSALLSAEVLSSTLILGELENNVEETRNGLSFKVQGLLFKVPLLGRFNIYNALPAICVGLSQGIALDACQKALGKAGGVPGRMEEVISAPFRVIVDYAFTPNALEQVYQCLTPGVKHKLICVLGACGGGRDKWKRPVLGEIAGKYCNEIIITNEDPYDENPMDIINQVAGAVKGIDDLAEQGHLYTRVTLPSKVTLSKVTPMVDNSYKYVLKILDRREAIKKALELAMPGDTVVITGKGCEPWICVENGRKIPWDDRQVAREEMRNVYNPSSNSSA